MLLQFPVRVQATVFVFSFSFAAAVFTLFHSDIFHSFVDFQFGAHKMHFGFIERNLYASAANLTS